MSKALIVTILTPTFGPKGEQRTEWHGSIGTGCAVRNDLVLTARHVVLPDRRDPQFRIKVRWYDFCARDDPRAGWVNLDDDRIAIRWAGEGELDAALIYCPRHAQAKDVANLDISPRLPIGNSTWESRGFPQASVVEELRGHGDFIGEVMSMSPNDGLFELVSRLQTQREENWRGASGMPVIVSGEIVGIVKDAPKYFRTQKLRAVPAFLLRRNPEFCEVLGCEVEPDLRDTVRNLMVELLKPSDSATTLLATRLAPGCGDIADCRRSVAEKALDTPLDDLFDIALDAQQALIRAGDHGGSDVIARLVQAVLPVQHEQADVEEVRARNRPEPGVLIELHASHKTIAEIVMAGADRRAAAFVHLGDFNEFPQGEGCLARVPEGGRDHRGEQFQRDLTEDLAQTFEAGFDTQLEPAFQGYLKQRFMTHLNSPPKNQSAANKQRYENQVTEWIRGELRRHARYRVRQMAPVRCGFTFYFLVDTPSGLTDAERDAQNAVLLRLKERFPEIAFVRLAPTFDSSMQELRPYSELRTLLYANQEPR
jgi:hypothetical protein